MRVKLVLLLVGFLFLATFHPTAVADVVLQTRNLRLEIGDDGVVKSLAAKPSGVEYGWIAESRPMALVYRGKQQFPASEVSLDGDKLVVRFAKANVTATYEVIRSEDYLALKLLGLEGEPVDRIELLQLKMKKLAYRGPWINVNYDDSFGICLCAGNIKTNAGMTQHKGYVVMRATAHKEVALEGTIAVLFGCPDPKNKFLDVMEIVERDFKMPPGAKNRRSPVQKYSYIWHKTLAPDNVDEFIKVAKRAGFRMILLSYGSFSEGAGHFRFNSRYPNGMTDLKKVTDAIRNAGLKVGLHVKYTKARQCDPYVAPVPDDRLNKLRTFTFAATVNDKADTIIVNENPKGCTLRDRERVLKAGKELIAYENYTTEPPFQFTGCRRGYLKSSPATHRAGDELGLLDVEDWRSHICILYDQDTDIQDETGRRIGEIFKQTGPYDMVYFDGAEDVQAPLWYHVPNAAWRVFRHLQPVPPVCEAATHGHFSWHMMTRSNAYDNRPAKQAKGFCRRVAYRSAPARAWDFTRINFGWVSHFFDNFKHDYVGPDTLEYILSRGAAWDCPFSLQMKKRNVVSSLHPRAEDCFDVIKIWEDARIENKLTDAQREMLRTLDEKDYKFSDPQGQTAAHHDDRISNKPAQEHHLFINKKGEYELVAIEEIPNVAGGSFKAYSFQRVTQPNDTYVLIWAVVEEADILLPVAADRLTVMRPFGMQLPVTTQGDKAVVRVGGRKYLVFAGMGVDQTTQLLRKAKLRAGKSSSEAFP